MMMVDFFRSQKCLCIVFFIHLSARCLAVSSLNFSLLYENLGLEITPECVGYLRSFSSATQDFDRCLVNHAKPLRICEKCSLEYSSVSVMDPKSFNKSVCVHDLVRTERFQVVLKIYDFQTGLWSDANCEKCYKSHWTLTNLTKEFFQKHDLMMTCVRDHTTIHQNYSKNGSGICKGCQKYYKALKKVYRKILQATDSKDEDDLCVDIMSAMNNTRRDWVLYDCIPSEDMNYTVLSITGVFSFLTFIYYVGVRKHEKYKSKVYARFQRPKRPTVNYDSE